MANPTNETLEAIQAELALLNTKAQEFLDFLGGERIIGIDFGSNLQPHIVTNTGRIFRWEGENNSWKQIDNGLQFPSPVNA